MIIFICNIPFIFFPAKQSILSVIELCGCCRQKRLFGAFSDGGDYDMMENVADDKSDDSFKMNASMHSNENKVDLDDIQRKKQMKEKMFNKLGGDKDTTGKKRIDRALSEQDDDYQRATEEENQI